jgi:indolepyruvate ferredoxin oxidoreductase beta subunit
MKRKANSKISLNETKNILIVGVGGQGVLLASEIIATAAMLEGYDVKKSEVHGMAQRGGSVSSHVRWGTQVFSPIIPRGKAHFLIALEMLEGIRLASWLRAGGVLILNHQKIVPASSYTLDIPYPQDVEQFTDGKNIRVLDLDVESEARRLGNVRLTNVILLGVLSRFLDFPTDVWQRAIEQTVKSEYQKINGDAFAAGAAMEI